MKKRIAATAVMTLLIVIILAGCGNNAEKKTENQEAATESGQYTLDAKSMYYGDLKNFSAKTLGGKTFTQEDIKASDVTLINFWSTDCGFCIQDMPEIAKLAKSLPENINVVTVCFDGEKNKDTAQKILKDSGFKGTTLISAEGDLKKMYGNVLYTPTIILMDGQGNYMGEVVINAVNDVQAACKYCINEVLKSTGKPEIE